MNRTGSSCHKIVPADFNSADKAVVAKRSPARSHKKNDCATAESFMVDQVQFIPEEVKASETAVTECIAPDLSLLTQESQACADLEKQQHHEDLDQVAINSQQVTLAQSCCTIPRTDVSAREGKTCDEIKCMKTRRSRSCQPVAETQSSAAVNYSPHRKIKMHSGGLVHFQSASLGPQWL